MFGKKWIVGLAAVLVLQSVNDVQAALLFSVDVGSDQLVTIDPATGHVNVVGSLGLDAADVDLAIHQGQLYGLNSIFTQKVELFRIDQTSGNASGVVTLTYGGQGVQNAEGLASLGSELIAGFRTVNPHPWGISNGLGTVNPLDGTIGSAVSYPFNTTDIDGLTKDETGIAEFITIDGGPVSSPVGYSTIYRANRSPQQYVPVIEDFPGGANDLAFLNSRLYGVGWTATLQPYLQEYDPVTGATLGTVLLDRPGSYGGIARVVPIPEPSSLLIFAGLCGLALIGRLGRRPRIK